MCGFKIKMGVPLLNSLNEDQLRPLYIEKLITNFNSKPFIIIPALENDTIFVTLHENISPVDIIEAFVRAIFTGIVIHQIRTKDSSESPVRLSLSSITPDIGGSCVRVATIIYISFKNNFYVEKV